MRETGTPIKKVGMVSVYL